ncbi:MAG: iron chelate uptake ABC transporter family permease subunit [Acholeplasma sp.]|nr:iron chelate uptake ABC transporter family permease subunit [Acholeplasma sp.]
MQSKHLKPILILGAIAAVAVVLYLFYWLIGIDVITVGQLNRGLFRRSSRIVAMIIVAITMGITGLVFQTMTNNRILTPSVIGFDSTFVLSQTLIVFIFGSQTVLIANPYYNFVLSSVVMVLTSMLLYGFVLRKGKNNLALLLLVGLVFRTLMGSLTSFLNRVIDPDDFLVVTQLAMPSLTNMNTEILWYIALPMMMVALIFLIKDLKYFDVMNLGEDQAKSLGVNYLKLMNKSLVLIAVLISVSTALVGPLMFLGLISVNLAREILKTDYHKPLFVVSALLGILFLVLGQFILQVFELNTSLAVLINLVGGIYMIYILIKGDKKS